MSNTSNRSRIDPIRRKLERYAKRFEESQNPFAETLRAFLTARDYNDITMMRAHLTTAIDTLREKTKERVGDLISGSQSFYNDIQEVLKKFEGEPIETDEDFDEIGKELSDLIDEEIEELSIFFVERVDAFQKVGLEIPNAIDLENEIKRWRALKENVIGTWPWSYRELPPVDRKMVQESRDAIKRGEGKLLRDVIRELNGNTSEG